MENLSPKVLNELFIQKLDSPEGLTKLAQEGSVFIRTKLREVSFARKIIQPQFVTKVDLQRSIKHDGLVKIVDIEPDSRALPVTFRGNPQSEYIVGERYEIPFFNISSKDFEKTEEELLAYEMPLTEVLERNSVLDIQAIEDSSFLAACDSAVTAEVNLGNQTLVSGLYNTNDFTINKYDIVKLFDTLDGNKLRSEIILMSNKTYNKLLLYPATSVGNDVGSEVQINGYTYSTLFGRKLVVSNKEDLLENKIYVFPPQEFLGQFLILNDTKFWIEKKKNLIRFAVYETIGMGIGNTKAVGKLTLA